MAFDDSNSVWITNYSSDGTNITIPIATFTELSSAEAHTTTGDIRKTLYAICEYLYDKWTATDAADRPAKMTISRSVSLNATTLKLTYNYSFRFVIDPGAVEVDAE